MNLNKISDKLIFKTLKFIKHGNIELINHDNKNYNWSKFSIKVSLICNF